MKPTRHSLVEVYVHLVWSTKNRLSVLDDRRLRKLRALAVESGETSGFEVKKAGGMEDHLHFLVRYRPDQRISDIVRILKSSMSYWLRRDGDLPDFDWQEGYGAFSISPQDAERIALYIEKQRQHHAEGTTWKNMEPA